MKTTELKAIIFLDIDGVLHSFSYEKYLTNHNKDWYDNDGAIFDPKCIAALETLINTTKARIVISSSWKDSRVCNDALSVLRGIWERRGLAGDIVGITPTLTPDELHELYGFHSTQIWKGYEIDQWLKRNPQCQSYVIIDDQNVILENQRPFFVKTDGNKGLTNKDTKKAIEIIAYQGAKKKKWKCDFLTSIVKRISVVGKL